MHKFIKIHPFFARILGKISIFGYSAAYVMCDRPDYDKRTAPWRPTPNIKDIHVLATLLTCSHDRKKHCFTCMGSSALEQRPICTSCNSSRQTHRALVGKRQSFVSITRVICYQGVRSYAATKWNHCSQFSVFLHQAPQLVKASMQLVCLIVACLLLPTGCIGDIILIVILQWSVFK